MALVVNVWEKSSDMRNDEEVKKMSKYAKYVDLTKLTTEYARRMTRLSNRIFGEVVRPTNSKSMKVVKLFSAQPDDLKTHYTGYYPRHVETGRLMMKLREYGLYRDEHADFADEMKRMRALRGKAKPVWIGKKQREAMAAAEKSS